MIYKQQWDQNSLDAPQVPTPTIGARISKYNSILSKAVNITGSFASKQAPTWMDDCSSQIKSPKSGADMLNRT